jgi:hypothetical protein
MDFALAADRLAARSIVAQGRADHLFRREFVNVKTSHGQPYGISRSVSG